MQDGNDCLLERAIAGDPESFAELFEIHREPLIRFCWAIIGDQATAEDVVQNTWARASRAVTRFDAGQPLRPWLMTIARRLCYDELRARRRRGAAEARAVALDLDTDVLRRTESVEGVRFALRRLPERYRRIVYLREVEGWSYDELARADGSTLTSIAKVLSRAKERLREGLERQLGWILLAGSCIRRWIFGTRLRGDDDLFKERIATAVAALGGVAILATIAVHSYPQARFERPFAARFDTARAEIDDDNVVARRPSPPRQLAGPGWEQDRLAASIVSVHTGQPRHDGVDPTGGRHGISMTDGEGTEFFGTDGGVDCPRDQRITPPFSPLQVRC